MRFAPIRNRSEEKEAKDPVIEVVIGKERLEKIKLQTEKLLTERSNSLLDLMKKKKEANFSTLYDLTCNCEKNPAL